MDRFLPLLALGLLTACGGEEPQKTEQLRDPAIVGALLEPLLTDPDLVGPSRNATLLSGGGPAEGGVPLFRRDDKEADRARSEAFSRMGGTIPAAPRATAGDGNSPIASAATAAGVAAAVPFAARCAGSLSYSFIWAARLPDPLIVYPRAHAEEAAGTDAAGCKLRVVSFRTPVTVRDVIDFYHAVALNIGANPQVSAVGQDQVVSGKSAALNFVVHARALSDGTTEADLIVMG